MYNKGNKGRMGGYKRRTVRDMKESLQVAANEKKQKRKKYRIF